jgi:isopenicillin-N epimerase
MSLESAPVPTLAPSQNAVWGDDWAEVRALWPLEPTVAHLNHGSFGAVPTEVLEEQRSWQDRMESNPVRFLARELPAALNQARAEVAGFIGVDSDAIAFVRNATTGVSTVLSSFELARGDEVLITDHAYGAVRIAADRWTRLAGAEVAVAHVALDADDDEVTDAVTSAVTDRTRIAVLDHITSPTARRLPLARLVPALQERGVAVLVDGAHATGMLELDLDGLGPDFWTGNLHKWCCAPRGAAVLYAAPARRAGLRPLVASWGEPSGFPEAFNDTGTEDPTAWLAAPRALRTLAHLDLARVRRHNLELSALGQRTVAEALALDPAALPGDPEVSMRLVPLPDGVAATPAAAMALQARIAEEAAVEVAVTSWAGHGFVRLSAHVYNAPDDYVRLAEALPRFL